MIKNRLMSWIITTILTTAFCACYNPVKAGNGRHPNYVRWRFQKVNDSTYYSAHDRAYFIKARDGYFYPCTQNNDNAKK